MISTRNSQPAGNTSRGSKQSHGMALVSTLLLLTVMMAMTLAMIISVTSDTLITKYYRNSRSAFYAADSGVNIARTAMLSSLSTAALTAGQTFSSGALPTLSSADVSTALSSVNTSYASMRTILGGSAANSWPSSFQIIGTQPNTIGTTLAGCTMGVGTCAPTTPFCSIGAVAGASNASQTSFNCTTNIPYCTGSCGGFSAVVNYTFPYTITAVGQSISNEQQIVEDSGSLVVTANFNSSAAYRQSFAAWGMFIDQFPECSGGYLVPGTISGPVFTNGAWTFGNTGSYTFTGAVGSASPTFGWQNGNGTCTESGTYPQPGFSTTFQSSVSLGANSVPLPANDFNQKEAVVDGLGNAGSITNAQMNSALKTANGTAYPSGGTTNPGVYMPYSTSSSSCGSKPTPCMTGGGIYVQGTANSVVLTAQTQTIGGVAHTEQVFTITQGSTTTTVTVDLTGGTTTMASQTGTGSVTTTVINGVPENLTGSSPSEAVMLYVDGGINSLSGPPSGAAIANGSAVTVDAGSGNNMTITGNLTYANEPVTMTQNQIPGTPADTLIPGNNSGQVLGLFTNGGNIQMSVPNSGQNLEIDASIATIKSGGSGGLVNTGNSINTLTIVGGRIQNTIQNIGTTTRNVWFDQRFAQGGFAPPWFPSTTVTPTNSNAITNVTSSVQRTNWLAAY